MVIATKNTPKPEGAGQPRPTRRVFTTKYKLRVLEEAERCREVGLVGSLLRREGLYASQLSTWRMQHRKGKLGAMKRKRGPAPKRTSEEKEVQRLRRENAKLARKLEQASAIIAAQKKLSDLLATMSEMPETGETS